MDKRMLAQNQLTKASDVVAMMSLRFMKRVHRAKGTPLDAGTVFTWMRESGDEVIALVNDYWDDAFQQAAQMKKRVAKKKQPNGADGAEG
jgi:hypothetical protein